MKRIHRPLTLAVVLMAVACQGCALFNPNAPAAKDRKLQQWAALAETYTAVNTEVNQLLSDGAIPAAQGPTILRISESTSKALDAMRMAAETGDTVRFNAELSAIRSLLGDLSRWRAEALRAKNN